MSIEYWVEENKLTVPMSYKARPQAIAVLQLEDIAARINLNIPNIPEDTAKTCLELLALIVKQEMINGNTVNLTNFVSFVVTIPARFPIIADIPTPTKPNVIAKPSPTFTAEVAALATYRRLGVIAKEPIIVSAVDATTGLQNWMREGFMLNVNGSNLNFNPNDLQQGLFFASPAGNTLRAANIAWLTDKTVIAIPEIDPTEGPAGAGSVEYGLQIKARYTPTGTLKTGGFNMLRKTNVIDINNAELFVKGSSSTGPAIISGYDGDQITARIVAQIRPDNVLTISAGTLTGNLGQAVVITGNGTYAIIGEVSLEIQVVDYNTLYSNVIQYQRYLQEVIRIGGSEPLPSYLFQSLTKLFIPRVFGSTLGYRDIAYGSEYFVAITHVVSGGNYYSKGIRSRDTINWSEINVPTNRALSRIVHGDGVFIISSSSQNLVWRSEDAGASWTEITLPKPEWFPIKARLVKVAYGLSMFVGVASNAALPDRLFVSSDLGLTWQTVNAPTNAWRAVAFGNNVFVVIGNNFTIGQTLVYDGVSVVTYNNISDVYKDIVFGNAMFVAVKTGNEFIRSSNNGATWTAFTVPLSRQWNCIIYDNGLFVVTASDGLQDCMMTSPDAVVWTVIDRPAMINSYLSSVAGNNAGLMVAVSDSAGDYLPRAFITFDQDSIPVLDEPVNVTVAEGEITYFKVSVPSNISQVVITLNAITSNLGLYVGIGYLPNTYGMNNYYSSEGMPTEQVTIPNTEDTLYAIGVLGNEAGSGVLTITLS